MNRGLQPPPREELYHEILPSGEVVRRASWGFQPPEPRSIGAKGGTLPKKILPSGEVVRRASWGFQPPEPRSIGAKREELYHEILPSGEAVLV